MTAPPPPPHGALTVTIEPPEAVEAGARWTLNSSTWYESNETVDNLNVGAYTVSFSLVQGDRAPDSEIVNIADDSTTTTTGTYIIPHAATATASIVNGYFVGTTITDPGYGYTNTPGVRIIGGGGVGAEATAQVTNGLVAAVSISNPGSGYTNTPVIVITPPFIPQPTMGIMALSQLSFNNLTVGTNYQLQSIVEGSLSNVDSPFAAINSAFTQLVSGNTWTNGHRLAVAPVPS